MYNETWGLINITVRLFNYGNRHSYVYVLIPFFTIGCVSSIQEPMEWRTQSNIMKVMSQNEDDIARLYNDALKRNPETSGKAVFQFTIKNTGIVKNSETINTEIKDKKFLIAVNELIFNTRFVAVKASKALTVSFPIDFYPK